MGNEMSVLKKKLNDNSGKVTNDNSGKVTNDNSGKVICDLATYDFKSLPVDERMMEDHLYFKSKWSKPIGYKTSYDPTHVAGYTGPDGYPLQDSGASTIMKCRSQWDVSLPMVLCYLDGLLEIEMASNKQFDKWINYSFLYPTKDSSIYPDIKFARFYDLDSNGRGAICRSIFGDQYTYHLGMVFGFFWWLINDSPCIKDVIWWFKHLNRTQQQYLLDRHIQFWKSKTK
jgi:hypothetical protein